MHTRRTCDRCYKIKARCIFEESSESCARCSRLGHICQTKRAVLRAGRPRTSKKNAQILEKDTPTPESLSQYREVVLLAPEAQLLPVLRGFKQYELSLIEFILQPDQIASLLYGQSFQNDMRSSLLNSLLTATDNLKDGFLAFAQALMENKNVQFNDLTQCTHAQNGSRALQKLRRFEIFTLDDARIALGLGLMLVTYNDLKVGAPTLPVSRSALLRAMPWRSHLLCQTTEKTDPNIICLLFVEIFECLVLSEIPVFRAEAPEFNTIVDRYYGICHELLPSMYDICLLYRSIKNDTISETDKIEQIDRINARVSLWTPELAMLQREDMILDEAEWLHFLLQAQAFKLAVQLLLLQAQRNSLSDMLASSKAAQLKTLISSAMENGPNKPKYLLFPYFVTCLEVHASNEMADTCILDVMKEISNGMAPKACQSMMVCLKHIWANKRRKPNSCWFECVDRNLLFAMGP